MPVDRKRRLQRYLSEANAVGPELQAQLGQLRATARRHISEPSRGHDTTNPLSDGFHFHHLADRDGGHGPSDRQQPVPQEARLPPLQRFRNYARVSLICIRLCKYSHENVKASEDEYLSIMQLTEDYIPDDDGDIAFFDPRIYRANKEERLPTDARKILKRDPRNKSQKDLDYLHIVLRSIKAFAEYPNQMQRKLVKVGWYEAYEPKRAIVRQGQPPHAFYFILSGSVVVTSYDHVTSTTTFLVSLHKGMSFGELAVVNRSKRQATVSTAATTEFLCISAKDFVEIFMAGGIQSVTDSDHNSFIRSIPFLKYWPVECLGENPQACLFHYFGSRSQDQGRKSPKPQTQIPDSDPLPPHTQPVTSRSLPIALYMYKTTSLQQQFMENLKLAVVQRWLLQRGNSYSNSELQLRRGQVIVRDSNHSDWIYIVKSGSLSVLKQLVEVHPRANNDVTAGSDAEDEQASSSISLPFGTWQHRLRKKKRRDSDDDEKEVYRNYIEMEKRLENTLPGFHNTTERLGIIDYDGIIQEHRTRVISNRRMSIDVGLPKIAVNMAPVAPKSGGADGDEEEDKALQLPKIRKTSKGAYLSSKSHKKKTKKEVIQEELFQKQMEYDQKMNQSKTIGRKTITNELDNKAVKDYTLTEKDIRPMFVQVQVLEKGQYFGLTKSVFPEQATSFSVISNGAECIMISKKFFFEKATEATLHHLRQVETLLPPEDELQSGLQDFVDWKAHRSKVYARLVTDKHNRSVRHHQFPPSYSGQYCFRTGPIVRSSVV